MTGFGCAGALNYECALIIPPGFSHSIAEGRIGEPLLVEADFGFRQPVEPEHRLFDLALGGGALLDLGIYPIQLCALVLGCPSTWWPKASSA